MVAISLGNILELLVSTTSINFALLFFFLGKYLKEEGERRFFAKAVRKSEIFLRHERGWLFGLAWAGTCIVFAILFPLYFSAVYESFDEVDAGSSILSFVVVYLWVMVLWLHLQYRATAGVTYWYLLPVILNICIAAAETVLVFVALKNETWTRYLVFLLFVPILFAISASVSSNNFRSEHHHHHESKKVESSIRSSSSTVPLSYN